MCAICGGKNEVSRVRNRSRSVHLSCPACQWGIPVFDWENQSVPFALTDQANEYLNEGLALR